MSEPKHKNRAKLYCPKRTDDAVQASVEEHGRGTESLLPILRGVQRRKGYLDSQALGATADTLKLPEAHVGGVAEFYSMLATEPRAAHVVRLCDGPSCLLAGAKEVGARLRRATAQCTSWCVERTSCLGLCDRAPAALVDLAACGPISPDRAESVLTGWRGAAPDYAAPLPGELRIAMAGMDADGSAGSTLANRYRALTAALRGPPQEVITEVERSGLRGCGGAGFPTGPKWRIVAEQAARPKYVVCNADESEPGAFKDRVLLEANPHQLLEGLALAGWAVGANQGVIYIRGEYEAAAQCLERAIAAANAAGHLGEWIHGSGFSFTVDLHRGAGAYICGEESALLESLEGHRGEPRVRPPYPTQEGFRRLPTVVNNVETLCKVPAVIENGAQWFRSLGTPDSAGTRVFSLSGHVRRPGVFEVPSGCTLRDLVYDMGGGMAPGRRFNMALTGGAAGTLVPESHLDVPLEFSSHTKGVNVGSGAIIAFDESISAVDVLEWLLHFFQVESCGKCTPCRQGAFRAHHLLGRLAARDGRPSDLAELRRLSAMLRATSLCGLGKSIAWPIDSALEHFSDEFAARMAT